MPFDVRLTDQGRNETQRSLVGSLNLDFTAPVPAAASVEPADARLGAVLQVFLTASEPLSGDPVLVASRPLDAGTGAETRFPMVRQAGTLNWTLAHLVTPLFRVADHAVSARDLILFAGALLAASPAVPRVRR